MKARTLTGEWYLRRVWHGAYIVMVEVTVAVYDEFDYSPSPENTIYEVAKPEDLVILGIKAV